MKRFAGIVLSYLDYGHFDFYICTCVYICVSMYSYIPIYTCIYIYMYLYIHVSIYTCIYIYMYLYTRLWIKNGIIALELHFQYEKQWNNINWKQ